MQINNFQMPEKIEKEESTYTDTYGKFIVQPLERGYGITLGNSLRRILVSSLPGHSIIAIKVNDAAHEFTTLKGVVEDLSEIILNLKEIRFKDNTGGRSNKIEFNVRGPHKFTAKDIQKATADFEILNPDKYIATLNKEANLDIELRIGSGVGYVPSEENKQTNLPLGFIATDSIFSPVKNVNYIIENTRVGKRTDYEKLILEITTDGSINPEDALIYSSRLLQEHIRLFLNLSPEVELSTEVTKNEEDEEFERVRKILLTPVDELDLSVRSQNCLRSANIKTIADLVSKDESDMLHYRNFGRKSLAELGELIENFGLTFGMDVDKYLKEEVTS